MPALLWLCRDFRFLDNPALSSALRAGPVLPVFMVDSSVESLGSAPRWRLERALKAFDQAWHTRTGERLTVLHGEAADHLPALAEKIGARQVHHNSWPWSAMKPAQIRLSQALSAQGRELVVHDGHLLISPERIQAEKGSAYRVYTPFARMLRRLGPDLPLPEVGAFAALPSRGKLEDVLPLAEDMHRGAPVLAEHALPAGEEAALAQAETFFETAELYPEGRDRPELNVGSSLSEALALGEVSARLLWARASLQSEIAPHRAEGLQKFLSELIWRDFAWHLLIDFPDLPRLEWRPEWRDFPWRGDGPEVEAWRQARTGIPLVDAGLREMRVTGRMHNRVRMVVASWLTKHLLADWRLGEALFADSLTDWDPASNAMNWQWVAGCGPDASPFFRIFNPVKQAQTYDPAGRYTATWLDPTNEQAKAYFKALPPGWVIPQPYVESAEEDRLRGGRERALLALADHRARRG